ncbi:MAG: hypothetical protein FWC32_08320 [Firmicutes bacterium]|nr:hypothetical protein [Bacillota bacterium]
MKTIKQIADEMGLPKQKVYRYIKGSGIADAHRDNTTSYYDAEAEARVRAHFANKLMPESLPKVVRSEPNRSATSASNAPSEVHQITSNDDVPQVVTVTASLDTLVGMLQAELEIKNQQIADLTKMLTAAQQAANQAQLLIISEARPGFFSRLFKRKDKADWERVDK